MHPNKAHIYKPRCETLAKTISVPNITLTLLWLSLLNITEMATPALKLLSPLDPHSRVRKALSVVKAMEPCDVEPIDDLDTTTADEYHSPCK